jgi:predicted amino acid dehydrogenase/ribosome-associated toxin RatA of RatAB toxin-antitoxin module
MPDDKLIEIRVSKIIPAPKWRVIRLVTKVGEFPSYIPCVREVSVIHKSHPRMLTRWRIQVDGVPISWTEEDTFELKQDTIRFKTVEGDLEEFKGEWVFRENTQGTQVIVNVYLKVGMGIPGASDFANTYVKEILVKNFEAILDAMERRLISTKYAEYKHGGAEKIAGFGIIGHPYNFHHLEKCFQVFNPDVKVPSREFLSQLFSLSPAFKMYDILDFKSRTSQTVNGCFVVATFIPDMIEKDVWAVFSKVVKACKIAEKHGVGIVTLGGFTSIVAERIGQEIIHEVDVPVTTGNTFTAAMVIDGVLKAAELLNIDVREAKIAIVGGTGDIGSACARVLSEKARQLTITGRTKANLKMISAELARKRRAKIIAATDNFRAVKDADIIIAAASASSAILDIDWFKPGAVICDVGYPKNISYQDTPRQDILIFSGGLSSSPTSLSYPIDYSLGLPSKDTIYGCFAEGIILALEKRYENFSFGRGNITSEKIDEIRDLGKRHGFEVSDFYWGDRLVDSWGLEKIKDAVTAG